MKNLDDLPIACTLTTAELGRRKATLLAQFRAVVVETDELQEGYGFRIPGDTDSIVLAGNVIAAERVCCPFLAFELVAGSGKGPVILRVTGPAGTKKVLRTLLCKT